MISRDKMGGRAGARPSLPTRHNLTQRYHSLFFLLLRRFGFPAIHPCVFFLLFRHVLGSEFGNLLEFRTGVLTGMIVLLEISQGIPLQATPFPQAAVTIRQHDKIASFLTEIAGRGPMTAKQTAPPAISCRVVSQRFAEGRGVVLRDPSGLSRFTTGSRTCSWVNSIIFSQLPWVINLHPPQSL